MQRRIQNTKRWMFRSPIDGNGATYGGNQPFISAEVYTDFLIHFFFGNVAADGTITLEQAKNVGGGDAKALAFDTIWLVKSDAGAVEDQDKAVRTTVSSNSFTVANATMDHHHMMVELHASQLDVQNGFDCFRPKFVGGAGATLVAIMVEAFNGRYIGDEQNLDVMPSMLKQNF